MSERLYYYVSLAYYNHNVYKCIGFGAENDAHRAFYLPHFERYGQEGTRENTETKGPYKVMILPLQRGRLIDKDGNALSLGDAIRLYR